MPKKPGKGKTQLFNSIIGDSFTNTPIPVRSSKTSSVSGRNGYTFEYNKSLVKTANERLRKLEKVNRLASQSSAYQSIKRFAIDSPNSMSNKFYRVSDDGSIRFINKTQFSKLSRFEQKKFLETVNSFLENQTSTKLGINKARTDSYNRFMENHPNLNWSQEEYEAFMKAKSAYDKDNEDRERYNRLTQFLEDPSKLDGQSFMNNGQIDDSKIDEILTYINNERRYSSAPVRGTNTNYRR